MHGYGELQHLVSEVVDQQKKTLVTVDVNSEKPHKVENGDSPGKKASNGIRSVPRPRRVQVGFDINAQLVEKIVQLCKVKLHLIL